MATLAFFALAFSIPVLAQPVRVMPVTDQAIALGAVPRGYELVNGVLYFDFNGGTGGAGRSLWKSDGTTAGTVLVKDVYTDFSVSSTRAVSNGLLYFYGANIGPSGFVNRGLWVSDGTLLGTRFLIATGTVSQVVDVNGTVYFNDDAHLYVTDGTASGTRVVSEHAQFTAPQGLASLGGALYYFQGNPFGGSGPSLYRTDGTVAGTNVVKSFASGSAVPFPSVQGGKLYFTADGGTGYGTWVSDGTTAGTTQVQAGGGHGFKSIGGYVYFTGTNPATGAEVWRTDGTQAGTVLVKDIEPGPTGSIPFDYAALGDTVIFSAVTSTLGRELWKTDGTAAGTMLVKDIAPGAFSIGMPKESRPSQFAMGSGALCFIADVAGRKDLWRTDGTEAGTYELVQDVEHDSISAPLVSTGTRVYFSKRAGTSGLQLWSSDCNTAAGNILVKDFQIGVGNTVYPTFVTSLTSMGTHLLIGATTAANGRELWRVDSSGPALVKDIEPGIATGFLPPWEYVLGTPGGDYPVRGAELRDGPYFWFRGNTSAEGNELWRSDGTTAGTMLVKDIRPGSTGSMPRFLTKAGDNVFFVADDGVHGKELWKSDDTEAGTVLVKEIVPEPYYGPDGLTNVAGTLYFSAGDGVHGTELWKSDGTTAGTVLVKDIVPGSASSSAYPIAALGSTLMFLATTPESGLGLWKTDGTEGGTVLVKSPLGFAASAVMNGVLYLADNSGGGTGSVTVWRSDGTESGTTVAFTVPGYSLEGLESIGDALYFWAGGYPSGGIWRSDGTQAGTVMLASAGYDDYLLRRTQFVELAGNVYFLAPTFSGAELWRTDGTPAGTYKLDLFPGFVAENPDELTVFDNRLYFIANDGVNPRSLYYYEPRPPSQEITRLGNLSSRVQVLAGDNVMIGGFVVGGPLSKCVAITATGPSLSQFGVSAPLQDPRLTLVRASDQAVIATNDDWQSAPASPCFGAEAFAVTDPREARIVAQLPPGAYTAIVQGASDTDTGVAVLGIYEVDQLNTPLVNLSARGPVFGGEQQMIGGFVIQGSSEQTVAVVATGPSLAAYGIANPLPNPVLTLIRQSDQSVVATNDNWVDAPNAALIEGVGFAPPQPTESAIMVSLPPGAYTAIVSGVGGGSGIGVIGVYRVN